MRKPHFRRFQRRKFCRFCANKTDFIDYKDIPMLRSFVTERGKIIAARMTGNCAKHQRELTTAIKRARNIALLPFIEK
jgi:small subunit ribosomal protein S18